MTMPSLVLALALAGAAPQVGPGGPPEIHELHIDVGGRSIRALCTDGRRRVLLLHGEGSSADAWLPVLERLDGQVGACAYDRSGSGESGPAPRPRAWFELVDEMRRIHLALGFDTRYVLVGHSVGGLYARLYAVDRPGEVAGLVLVEPAHEDMPELTKLGMPDSVWDAWTRARRRPNEDGVTEATVAERARGTRLPDIPVTVITAARRPDGEGWDPRFLNEAARQVAESILRGITSARHVPASGSGHDVPLDDPDLVAREILRIAHATNR